MRTKPTLRQLLLDALAESSSQQPVDMGTLYPLGTRKQVEATLLEMYHAQEICCCKISNGSGTFIMWWIAGNMAKADWYGIRSKK